MTLSKVIGLYRLYTRLLYGAYTVCDAVKKTWFPFLSSFGFVIYMMTPEHTLSQQAGPSKPLISKFLFGLGPTCQVLAPNQRCSYLFLIDSVVHVVFQTALSTADIPLFGVFGFCFGKAKNPSLLSKIFGYWLSDLHISFSWKLYRLPVRRAR